MGILTNLKNNNPNIYSLVVSLLLAVWYNGISGALNYCFPEKSPFLLMVMLVFPVLFFLIDDGNLDELYTPPTSVIATAAAQQQNEAQTSKSIY